MEQAPVAFRVRWDQIDQQLLSAAERHQHQGTLAEAEARENLGAVLHAEIVQPEDGPDGPLFAHFFLRVRASCAPVRVPIGRF